VGNNPVLIVETDLEMEMEHGWLIIQIKELPQLWGLIRKTECILANEGFGG
jgi:hypothetical protein